MLEGGGSGHWSAYKGGDAHCACREVDRETNDSQARIPKRSCPLAPGVGGDQVITAYSQAGVRKNKLGAEATVATTGAVKGPVPKRSRCDSERNLRSAAVCCWT